MDLETIAKDIAAGGQPGLLAMFGAAAKYIHITVAKGQPFFWGVFLGNLFIAFFIGIWVGSFLEPTYPWRDGILMACGLGALQLLEVIEQLVLSSVRQAIERWRGSDKSDREGKK